MLKEANKRFQRIGTEPVKVVFTVDVKNIIFSDNSYADYDGAILSVCFERGGKLASSQDKPFRSKTNNHSFEVNESLSLVVTLYKDHNGDFQEKNGKIILRQFKKSKNALLAHMSGYKGIGTITLPLHELFHEGMGSGKEMILPFQSTSDVKIQLRLSVRFVGDGDDDDGSVVSEHSEMSTLAAMFDTDSQSNQQSARRFSTGKQSNNNRSSSSDKNNHIRKGNNSSSSSSRPVENIKLESEAIRTLDIDNEQKVEPQNEESMSPFTTDRKENIEDEDEDENNDSRNNVRENREKKMKFVPASIRNTIKAKRTTPEQLEWQAESSNLQKQLQRKELELINLRKHLQQVEEDSRAQILTLRTDLTIAQTELRKMQLGKSAVSIANEKADGVLAAALARAREEAAANAEDYASASAALQATKEELARSRMQLEKMTQLLEEEKQASLDAATVASAASYRQAELESENEELIEKLIEAKMECATVALECAEERRKLYTLKRRLQKYAERVASLEVSKTLSKKG